MGCRSASFHRACALSPAKVSHVLLAEEAERRTANVIVPDGQLSLAIGREGQNARLAAKLTGWRIDIRSESETAEILEGLLAADAARAQHEAELAADEVIEILDPHGVVSDRGPAATEAQAATDEDTDFSRAKTRQHKILQQRSRLKIWHRTFRTLQQVTRQKKLRLNLRMLKATKIWPRKYHRRKTKKLKKMPVRPRSRQRLQQRKASRLRLQHLTRRPRPPQARPQATPRPTLKRTKPGRIGINSRPIDSPRVRVLRCPPTMTMKIDCRPRIDARRRVSSFAIRRPASSRFAISERDLDNARPGNPRADEWSGEEDWDDDMGFTEYDFLEGEDEIEEGDAPDEEGES